MIELLLFLLLPVAAASGWWAARQSDQAHARSLRGRGAAGLRPDPSFFRGLNYLLDEQPNKAIDVFLKLAEVDGETVETHLALGSLYRRRGEVDRAIHIHQRLLAQSNLSREQRGYALFELGQDYMCAGLFDRAEAMFHELVAMDLHQQRALKRLLEIYQQEKEWARCLEVAEQLGSITGDPTPTESAQYHCELAEEAIRDGQEQRASSHLASAQAVDANCVRATMLQARIARKRGDAPEAARLYLRVAEQGPQFLPEILPDLLDACRGAGRDDRLSELERLYRDYPSSGLACTLADALRDAEGEKAAIAFLVDYISARADLAGLERLLLLQGAGRADDTQTRAVHRAVLGVVAHLRARQPDHQCAHCGFVARRLHWQCPSCKRWGSIEPVQPESIDPGPDSAGDVPSDAPGDSPGESRAERRLA